MGSKSSNLSRERVLNKSKASSASTGGKVDPKRVVPNLAKMTSKNPLEPPPVPKKPVTIAIVGAGARGQNYATYAKYYPEWLKVVAVADPHDYKRSILVEEHDIPKENVFKDWAELAKKPKLCDAVAICTQDHLHTAPAIAFANLKYSILLEKPMAVSLQECKDIVDAIKKNGVIFAVGHVLRYTPYTASIMKILESKAIGDVINIQHLEPVGFFHYAHSFVRGNWGNESRSTFSLMSKSCHDIDLVPFMMGAGKCVKISSFGSLAHFNKKNKPKEAGKAKKCLDCAYESKCPYSAKKIYVDPFVERGYSGWPTSIVLPAETIDIENLTEALQTSNYGSCVYEVDNDVCDNQVVNMEFENGLTASFSMVAFTEALCERKTRIFGSRGQIEGDGVDEIVHFDFLTRKRRIVNPSEEDKPAVGSKWSSGHGGGDFGLMKAFVYACASGNQEYILSGPEETLDSHIYVFAAEEARKTSTVVNIEDFKKRHNL